MDDVETTLATGEWPSGKVYLVRYGDKFGYACRCASAIGDFMVAATYRRDPSGYYGITEIQRSQYCSPKLAVLLADTVHGNADGMGKLVDYRSPAAIAHEFGWS